MEPELYQSWNQETEYGSQQGRKKEPFNQLGVAPRSLVVTTEAGSELRRYMKDIIKLPQPRVDEQETQTESEQDKSQIRKHLHNLVGVTMHTLPL